MKTCRYVSVSSCATLTLNDKPYFGGQRLRCHLIGDLTLVDSAVVRRLNGEDQLVLRSVVSGDVRKVQFVAVAEPIDLGERIAAT